MFPGDAGPPNNETYIFFPVIIKQSNCAGITFSINFRDSFPRLPIVHLIRPFFFTTGLRRFIGGRAITLTDLRRFGDFLRGYGSSPTTKRAISFFFFSHRAQIDLRGTSLLRIASTVCIFYAAATNGLIFRGRE